VTILSLTLTARTTRLSTPTPYPESLERVRSVLVFFAATGSANAAVLAELELEVRIAVGAARRALLGEAEVQSDLERLATLTLPPSAAANASRVMRSWVSMTFERTQTASAKQETRP
jgi:hypothetical protein